MSKEKIYLKNIKQWPILNICINIFNFYSFLIVVRVVWIEREGRKSLNACGRMIYNALNSSFFEIPIESGNTKLNLSTIYLFVGTWNRKLSAFSLKVVHPWRKGTKKLSQNGVMCFQGLAIWFRLQRLIKIQWLYDSIMFLTGEIAFISLLVFCAGFSRIGRLWVVT